MRELKFAVGLPIFDAPTTVKLGILAEKLGYNGILIADHLIDFDSCRIDPWIALSGIGVLTSRVELGTAVTDIQRVHPAKLAQISSTLDELTNGRAILGVGAGEVMNTVPFGIEWEKSDQRISRLIEATKIIRLLWSSSREKTVNFQGEFYRLSDAWLGQRHSISHDRPKLYIGALHSPKLLRAIGELADGWLDFLSTPVLFEKKIGLIKEGVQAAGREVGDMDLTAWIGICFTKDSEQVAIARKVLKRLLVSEGKSLKRLGLGSYVPENVQYTQVVPTSEVIAKVRDFATNVPDDIADKFMICGDNAKEAAETLDRFAKLGAKQFELLFLSHKNEEMMANFAEKVLSTF